MLVDSFEQVEILDVSAGLSPTRQIASFRIDP